MRNTILRAGDPREEGGHIASEALTPGELVEFGGSDDIQAHSGAGLNAIPMFPREQWENDGHGIDDDIPAGDEATVLFARSGDKIYAFLDSSSANAAVGDALESAGNGNLRTQTASAATAEDARDSVVAYAAEAVTSPGSGRTRIEVYVA